MASTSEIERIFGDPTEDAKRIYNEFMMILVGCDDLVMRNNLLDKKIHERKEDIQLGIFRDMKELAHNLFHDAIKNTAPGLCKVMLLNVPELLNTRDEGGNGPQHTYANYYASFPHQANTIFNLLFNENTDLAPNKKGMNPIHIVAEKMGGPSIVYGDRFIKKFENLRLFDIWFIAQDKQMGWTPLMYRVHSCSVKAFNKIPGIYELHVIKNIKSLNGQNIFHMASMSNMENVMKKCMKFCMSSKTHPQNDKDQRGKRPLDYAHGKVAAMLTSCVKTYISEENKHKTPEGHVVERRSYLLAYHNVYEKQDLQDVMSSYPGLYCFQVKYPFFFDIVTRKPLLDVWLSLYGDTLFFDTLNRSWKIRAVTPGKLITNTTAVHALMRTKNWKVFNYIATSVKGGKINLNVTNSLGRTPLTYMEDLAFFNNCYDKRPSAYTKPNPAITDIIGKDVISNVAIRQVLRQRFGRPDEVQKGLDEALIKTLTLCDSDKGLQQDLDTMGFKVVLCDYDKLKEVLEKGANPAYNNNEAMARCATLGYIEEMKMLIKYGAQANAPHRTITPLGNALRNRQVETVKFLLSLDVDVNWGNPNAFRDVVISPWYSMKKYNEVIKMFMQWERRNHVKITIFEKDKSGNSTYMLALEKMDMQEEKNTPLEERMQENALGNFIKMRKHLLHSTYNARRWEKLKTAIIRKEWSEELEATILPSYKLALPPPQVSSINTLLEIAVMEKNFNVVERMVKYLDFDIVSIGREQNIYDFASDMLEMNYDTTLVDIVNLMQYHRAMKLNEKNYNLLNDEQKDALYTRWQTAIVTMDEASIRQEFENGARINDIVFFTLNHKDYAGGVLQVFLERAPLTTRQRSALKTLVDFGADVNLISEEDGLTPLMLAIKKKATNCIHILAGFPVDWKELANVVLEKPKLKVDLQDSFGVTALMMAAATGDQRLFDAVIRLNPDPNITDKTGLSVLNYAKTSVIFENLLSMPTLKIQMHTNALVEFIKADNTSRVFKMLQRGAMLPNNFVVSQSNLSIDMFGVLKRYEEAQQVLGKGPVEYLKALANSRLFAQIKETFGEEIIKYNNIRMMGDHLIVWAYKNQFYMLVNYMLEILQQKFPDVLKDLQDYVDVGTGEIIRRGQSVRLLYSQNWVQGDSPAEFSFKRYEIATAKKLINARKRTSEGRVPYGFVEDPGFEQKIINYLMNISLALQERMETGEPSHNNNSREELLEYGKKIIDTAGDKWEKRLEEFVKENPSLSNALKQYSMSKRNRAAIIAINKANQSNNFMKLKF